MPRISPDGQWLAFSADQNGNMDVYVMPFDGGEVRQLTYHESSDEVDSWSWDGKNLYFTSGRANRLSSYKVSVEGGTPKRIFPHFFNYIHNMVERPNGELLYTDSWESYSAANRKRYKGAFNPDIRGYDPKTNTYKDYTTYIGKDLWPTVDREGAIFFASDQGNDEYNLYSIREGGKKQLTEFDESIRKPQVAANGDAVVFEKGYQIFLYNVSTGQTTQPSISLSRNQVLGKPSEYDVNGKISFFDLSPDGKKIAFVSRGELFVSD
ncbi:MAG: S41 family peptidase, partial [Sphingobacterium sp.]